MTLFKKFVKINVVDSSFAITASFFRFHKKKWNSNFNYFRQLLFHTFFHPMNFIFLVLKTKIGRCTQKSAANDAYILVGCISKPKNICIFWSMRGQIKKCVFYELGFFHIRSFLNKVIFHRGVINIHLFDIVIYFKTNIKCNFPILKDEGWLLSLFEGFEVLKVVGSKFLFYKTCIDLPLEDSLKKLRRLLHK